ncbi:hypothetical protein ZWY2020_046700, partial [Hordeum vulgare]
GGSAPIKDDGHDSDEEYERQHNIVGDVEAQVRHDDMDPDILDMMFYGPLEKCPICGGQLECKGWKYKCTSKYSEWASCIFSSNSPPRKYDPIKVPEDWLKRQEGKGYPKRDVDEEAHIFSGMMVALSGRMSRSHEQILNHGGQVNNSVLGVTCVVAFPAERDKGVSENWIVDSIQKKEAQPLAAYDIVSDVVPEGRGLPLDKLDPSEEAIMTLAAQLKLARKRSVHKDSKLGKDGGCIFEKDDIIYNCACSICDLGSETNQLYIMQLIMLPEEHLHLFYKKGPIGHDHMAEERVEDFGNRVNDAIKEFARVFKEVTGNDFEPWEREKKFEKKSMKMYPLDMDVGFDVRHGGAPLSPGAAARHRKLDPTISFLLKQLYALTEMAQDLPDLPIGMLTDAHLKRGSPEEGAASDGVGMYHIRQHITRDLGNSSISDPRNHNDIKYDNIQWRLPHLDPARRRERLGKISGSRTAWCRWRDEALCHLPADGKGLCHHGKHLYANHINYTIHARPFGLLCSEAMSAHARLVKFNPSVPPPQKYDLEEKLRGIGSRSTWQSCVSKPPNTSSIYRREGGEEAASNPQEWIINDYYEQGNMIITNLLLPLGHISNPHPSRGPPTPSRHSRYTTDEPEIFPVTKTGLPYISIFTSEPFWSSS